MNDQYLDNTGLSLLAPKIRKLGGSSMTQLTNEGLNDIKTAGWYYTYGSDTVLNKPDATCTNIVMQVVKRDSTVVQYLYSCGNGNTYIRHFDNNTWSDWEQTLDSSDIGSVNDTQWASIQAILG